VKISNLNTIRVLPFCGKVDECPIWSEKFLAKAKRYGFKDTLVGKLSIPRVDDVFDEVSDLGKKMSRSIKLNEIAYTELILSIDVKRMSLRHVRVRIILTVMQQVLGKSSRMNMNLFLPLP
jgi:hypothetical protein